MSQGAPRQTGACVVTSDQGFVVIYRSETSGSMRIVGQRLDAWGNPIDAQPYTVHGPAPHLGRPRAARIGGEFLVTWAEDGAQRARRILADGAPLDAAPITIQPVSAEGVDVAALNGRYLAVGVNNPTHVHVQSVFGVRLSSTGALLDPAPAAIGASYARGPSAAAHAGRWFVTWTRNATHDNPIASVASVFVQPDGSLVANVDLSPSMSGLHGSDVAVTGGTALAVWSEPSNGGHDIHGTRVDAAGVPLDGPFGVPLLAAAETQRAAVVGSTGTGYAVLCEDQRGKTFFLDDRTDLYGARVDTNGVSLDPSGFPVLAEGLPVVEPSVAGGAGRAVLAFSRFAPDAPYAAYRLTLRVLNPCPGAGSTSGSGCPGSGGFAPSLSHTGCPSPGESAAIVLSGGFGGAQTFLVFGQASASLPAGFGCDLHVAPLLPFTVPLTLSGDGEATLPFVTPPGLVGVVHTQAFLVDPGAAGGFTSSNALSLQFQ